MTAGGRDNGRQVVSVATVQRKKMVKTERGAEDNRNKREHAHTLVYVLVYFRSLMEVINLMKTAFARQIFARPLSSTKTSSSFP